jgi:hypothetical protein
MSSTQSPSYDDNDVAIMTVRGGVIFFYASIDMHIHSNLIEYTRFFLYTHTQNILYTKDGRNHSALYSPLYKMADNQQVVKETTVTSIINLNKALKYLNAKGPDLNKSLDNLNETIYAEILQGISTFLGLTVGNPNQLWEKITALTYTEEKVEHLRGGSKGADLQCQKGTIENKTSCKPKSANKYATSWMFCALKVRTKEELLEKLLKKMSYQVVFTAVHAETGQVLQRYVVDGLFVANYLTRLAKIRHGKSNAINLGSTQCPKCHHYHRLLWLKTWSEHKTQWTALDAEKVDPDFEEIDKMIDANCADLSKKDKVFMGL